MEELSETFEKYIALNKRSLEEILDHEGEEFSIDLYTITKIYAPTVQEIQKVPDEENWHVKRAPGTPVFTTEYYNYHGRTTIKTYKKAHRKSRSKHLFAYKVGEINRRQRHVGYAASGWLSHVWGRHGGRTMLAERHGANAIVQFHMEDTKAVLVIENPLPGIATLDDEYDIVGKAMDRRKEDMEEYIKKKMEANLKEAGITK